MSVRNVPIKERLLLGVTFRLDGCWPWTGAKDRKGYGWIFYHGKARRAHRLSYEIFQGSIPDGLQIDHLCKNPACLNPEHMEPVTLKENVLRGNGITAINSRKTVCKRGHQLCGDNVIRTKLGRACRACRAYERRTS